MTPSGNSEVTVQGGYRLIGERVRGSLVQLASISVSEDSAVAKDDEFLRPICHTYQEGSVQAIHSALDHLILLADSLNSRPEPHPFAQSTLIRTAITAASIAVWLSSDDQTERRCRTLEFFFRDNRFHLGYLKTVLRQPQVPEHDRAVLEALIAALRSRQHWIIAQAKQVCSADPPVRAKDFHKRTSDTCIVELAGGALGPEVLGDGWDPAVSLLATWQNLSGYAHASPWSSMLNRRVLSEPDRATGQVTVSPTGNAETLLDAAFRAVIVAEKAISQYETLSG